MSFIDTLRSAFKGGGGNHVPLARSFTSPWFWTDDRSGGRRTYDYGRDVGQAFMDNPVAQRAIRIVSESLGTAPLSAMDPAVETLVRATSAGQSLLETLTAHLLLHGNAYVQIIRDGAGAPIELFALRPDRVTVELGLDGAHLGLLLGAHAARLLLGLSVEGLLDLARGFTGLEAPV